MKTVDLHVHSIFSDGTDSPKELVRLAKKAELSAFALTDHDTVSGIPKALQAGRENGIEVIPGVELGSTYKDKEIHIVGLCMDYTNPQFIDAINEDAMIRQERNIKMVQAFVDYGFPITMEELEAMCPDNIITRAHFATWLIKKGYVKDNKEAFDKYIGNDMPLYVKAEKRSAQEAVKIIKAAGGAAILAHPLMYHLTSGELHTLCGILCSAGLDGIETLYSTNKGFDELTVRKLAREFNLLESGGSDYHGRNKPYIQIGNGMGNLRIPYDYLDKIKEAVNYSPKE